MREVVMIGGPTASGKTGLAIRLAQELGAAIISADSRQVYRGLDIGTAKPTLEERKGIPHHLIDCYDLDEDFSAGRFEREALAIIEQEHRAGRDVIVAGGTGLYLEALWKGMDAFPEVPEAHRQTVRTWYEEGGITRLQEALLQLDPDYADKVDLQNPHRLMRALGVCLASGQPYSTFRRGKSAERPFAVTAIWLNAPREWLYQRINERVTHMMAQGLLEEARVLYPRRSLPALQTVGYQELFRYLDGEIDLDAAIELIRQNTRRYAKRQVTWQRGREGWLPLPVQPEDTLFTRAMLLVGRK
jgi:tRNA dimethylallyltransferase